MGGDDVLVMLQRGSVFAAEQLIGWRFYVQEVGGSLTGGMIAETEAYSQEDAASHTYNGRTPRNDVMFGPAGRLYVYFTYGMHWCANIVTGEEGHGEGVLLRALIPDRGLEYIRERRHNRPDHELANGPAKLAQALAITGADNGAVLNQGRFTLVPPVGKRPAYVATKRIGIKKDKDRLWRFVIA